MSAYKSEHPRLEASTCTCDRTPRQLNCLGSAFVTCSRLVLHLAACRCAMAPLQCGGNPLARGQNRRTVLPLWLRLVWACYSLFSMTETVLAVGAMRVDTQVTKTTNPFGSIHDGCFDSLDVFVTPSFYYIVTRMSRKPCR